MSLRGRWIGSIGAVLLLSTTALVILRARAEPGPTLADIARLAEAGRLDQAETSLSILLKRDSRDPEINLLAAQVAMGRSEPVTTSGIGSNPAPALKALECLGRAKSQDGKLAAVLSLWKGKAERYLGHLEEAEAAWLEALRLDPTTPEAGWLLLQEYYLQGRSQEVQALALRLHRFEPDPRDRILLLMEPIRQEVMPPAPGSLVQWFHPIAALDPTRMRANLALGLALVRSNESDRGMDLLRKMLELYPDRQESWDVLMTALEEKDEIEELGELIQSLPAPFSEAPWNRKYKARVAENRGDLPAAARLYRGALEASPADSRLEYRLARLLRRIGQTAEADRLEARHQARQAWNQEAKSLYESAMTELSTGILNHSELFQKLATLREKMGYTEQALAWRRLAGTPDPGKSSSSHEQGQRLSNML